MSHSPADEDGPAVGVTSLTWAQAAARLNVQRGHVGWLVRFGHLCAVEDAPDSVAEASVEALCRDRAEWISATTAAEILGCGRSGVWTALAAGHLTQRRRGKRPSLSRSSVLAYRTRLDAQAEEAQQREREQRRLREPPDAEHVWVTPPVLALMAGYGANRARQLLTAGRVPAVKVGARWWIRRDHAEQWVAARALTRARANPTPAATPTDGTDPVEQT